MHTYIHTCADVYHDGSATLTTALLCQSSVAVVLEGFSNFWARFGGGPAVFGPIQGGIQNRHLLFHALPPTISGADRVFAGTTAWPSTVHEA